MKNGFLIVLGIILIVGAFFLGNSINSSSSNNSESLQVQINNLELQNNQLQEQIEDLTNQLNKETGFVFGKVTLDSGNCMPGPPGQESSCSIGEGVSRTVYVRELIEDIHAFAEPFSENSYVPTGYLQDPSAYRLIKSVTSDSEGNFRIELPSGKYTLTVEDEEKEYCQSWTENEGNCLVEIIKNQETEFDLKIDHASH